MKPFILVVDDDPVARQTNAKILEIAGYPVLEAANAIDAISLLEEHPRITLLFTAIDMPAVNGYVLADMAVTRWPNLRILYTAGEPNSHVTGGQPGLLHGEVLNKSFRAAQLTTAVAGSLARACPGGRWGRAPPGPAAVSTSADGLRCARPHPTGLRIP